MDVDPETLAAWAYFWAGASMAAPPGPAVLLEALVGVGRIRFGDGHVQIVSVPVCGYRVRLPVVSEASGRCVAFATACALVSLRAHGLVADPQSAEVHDIAAAIVMPAPAIAAVVDLLGYSIDHVASVFVVPPELAQRRLRRVGRADESGEFPAIDPMRVVG